MTFPINFRVKRPSCLPRLALAVTLAASLELPMSVGTDVPTQPEAKQAATTQPATATIVAAAKAFLATLSEKQRAAVLYKFDDNEQRARWSNFPIGVVPRGGLDQKDLTEVQRTAEMQLIAAALSARGFEKVQQIMDADEVLKSQPNNGPGGGRGGGPEVVGVAHAAAVPEVLTVRLVVPVVRAVAQAVLAVAGRRGGGRGPGGGGGGGGAMFGKDLYYISFLGTPSEHDPWMLQFGGHHLALNITIVGERGILTPSLTGAQPGTYTSNGKTIRPLGQENDKAFALLNALEDGQRKQAILNYDVGDLVLGPGQDGQTIQPEGLKVSAMNEKQRAMLVDLIAEWSGIVNDSYADARMSDIKAGLNDSYFAWSGPTTVEPGKNGTSYYRIQGPKLVIEYAPQRDAEHIHTIYRDPTNDYGRAAIAKS